MIANICKKSMAVGPRDARTGRRRHWIWRKWDETVPAWVT